MLQMDFGIGPSKKQEGLSSRKGLELVIWGSPLDMLVPVRGDEEVNLC